MKATITNRKNKFTSSHRKETKCYFYIEAVQAIAIAIGYPDAIIFKSHQ